MNIIVSAFALGVYFSFVFAYIFVVPMLWSHLRTLVYPIDEAVKKKNKKKKNAPREAVTHTTMRDDASEEEEEERDDASNVV